MFGVPRLLLAIGCIALSCAASPIAAQGTPPVDSAAADSARAQALAAVRVDVTRGEGALDRITWAVGTQDARDLRRGQPTLGIDEALNNIPGVLVSNRYNYAQDQRLSIRGAGSRANFGLRGVKVLLDGIPQSLPDGQSQLTNIDLAAIGSVEVLRGSASSLYGNGSGGVLSFETDLTAPERLGATIRALGGAFGTSKTFARVSGRAGATVGALSMSRTTLEGFRQFSTADTRQVMAALDHQLGPRTVLAFRGGSTDTPESLNPGALTPAEYAIRRDSAAPFNVRRGARKEVGQQYLSARVRQTTASGGWSAALYGQWRDLYNPIPAPPPGVAVPADSGVLITLDRTVSGARFDAERRFATTWPSRVFGGLDVQRAFDRRRNDRTTGGRIVSPADTMILRQDETTTSVGPFVQAQLEPHRDVTLGVGGRWDRISFRAEDRFTGDGADDSGERTLTAASGQLGIVWRARPWLAPYANVSTAFETPTTTELSVRPDGQGGFNPDLDPQRVRTFEVGARGRLGGRVGFELAMFDGRTTDAIVQYLETGARAYFRNAGSARNRGVELGLTAVATDWLQLRAAWTHADYRFEEYRVVNGAQVDTLDGNQLPGVPNNVLRLGLRSTWRGFALDADHTWQGALYADDRNSAATRVDGWGHGQLNVRTSWSGTVLGWRVEPFVSAQNLLNVDYVGSITVNGAFNRVLEPSPLRHWFFGLELGAPLLR
jgi:iron complex outermembrane receptor protein